VFLLLMVRQCFQFSVPLRSVADNNSFATSNAVALVINAIFIIVLMPHYGLWGPTLGLVGGQMWTSLYLGRRLLKRYNLPLSDLCEWGKLGLALAASLLALAALYGMQSAIDGRAGALAGLGAFAVVYVIAARLILREEYGYIVRALSRRTASPKRGA
jgi:O-antigen/teichoic acid export membrane protein